MRDILYTKKEQTKFFGVGAMVFLGVMCFIGMFGASFEPSTIPTDSIDFGPMQQVAYTGGGCFQPVAARGNGLKLPMGVTLVGKGMITEIVPGSKAFRAGLQIGDVINRINGK